MLLQRFAGHAGDVCCVAASRPRCDLHGIFARLIQAGHLYIVANLDGPLLCVCELCPQTPDFILQAGKVRLSTSH